MSKIIDIINKIHKTLLQYQSRDSFQPAFDAPGRQIKEVRGPAPSQLFNAPFPRLKREKVQVLAPFPLAAGPTGQRGRRSVVVQYEV